MFGMLVCGRSIPLFMIHASSSSLCVEGTLPHNRYSNGLDFVAVLETEYL